MTRSLAAELRQLTAEVIRMGGLAEAQVVDAVDAVVRRELGSRRVWAQRTSANCQRQYACGGCHSVGVSSAAHAERAAPSC